MIAAAALSSGMREWSVKWVASVDEATDYLRVHLREGDVVLVKGSHGLRMDRIVNALEVSR
jgi:UDP-N-acetylmuramoyl-tripeptide--D-alanyl-D-alanine ligase